MKENYIKKFLSYMFLNMLFFPMAAYAAAPTVLEIETMILSLLGSIVPVLVGAATVFFLWAVFRFMRAGEDAALREKTRGLLVYGIVTLTVMISIWGIIAVLGGVFGIKDQDKSGISEAVKDFIVKPPY